MLCGTHGACVRVYVEPSEVPCQEGKVGTLGHFMGTECLAGGWLNPSSAAMGSWRHWRPLGLREAPSRAQPGGLGRRLEETCSGPWA